MVKGKRGGQVFDLVMMDHWVMVSMVMSVQRRRMQEKCYKQQEESGHGSRGIGLSVVLEKNESDQTYTVIPSEETRRCCPALNHP